MKNPFKKTKTSYLPDEIRKKRKMIDEVDKAFDEPLYPEEYEDMDYVKHKRNKTKKKKKKGMIDNFKELSNFCAAKTEEWNDSMF